MGTRRLMEVERTTSPLLLADMGLTCSSGALIVIVVVFVGPAFLVFFACDRGYDLGRPLFYGSLRIYLGVCLLGSRLHGTGSDSGIVFSFSRLKLENGPSRA